MKNFEFLFWAYTSFFLIIAAFLVSLLVRLARAERELRRIAERVGAGGTGKPPS